MAQHAQPERGRDDPPERSHDRVSVRSDERVGVRHRLRVDARDHVARPSTRCSANTRVRLPHDRQDRERLHVPVRELQRLRRLRQPRRLEWKVRARSAAAMGPWSEERSIRFAPCRSQSGLHGAPLNESGRRVLIRQGVIVVKLPHRGACRRPNDRVERAPPVSPYSRASFVHCQRPPATARGRR